MSRKVADVSPRQRMEPLLSVTQVADVLSVCTKTVYRHITDGKLKAVRAGRLWRVPPASLRAFLHSSGDRE